MALRAVLGAGLLAFLIDQISKRAIVFGMELQASGTIDVLPPLLTFRYGENRGINFGVLDGGGEAQRWLLIGLSLAIMLAVIIWVHRTCAPLVMQLAAGLLIGGALGNILDRLLYGFVLDFLNMSCCGIRNPYVFNLADVFIFIGAISLVVLDGRRGSEKPS